MSYHTYGGWQSLADIGGKAGTWVTEYGDDRVTDATGIYLERAANTITFPVDLLGMTNATRAAGGALLGIATALTATRQPFLRTITALVLGIGYGLLTNVSIDHYLTAAYIAVLAWWALTTATVTIRAAAPRAELALRRWTTSP